jgi:hypothetical protein
MKLEVRTVLDLTGPGSQNKGLRPEPKTNRDPMRGESKRKN